MTKNLLYIFLGLLIFAGCSKSSKRTVSPANAATISGKWLDGGDSILMIVNGQQSIEAIDAPDKNNYMQFNTDGTGVEYTAAFDGIPALSVSFTYTVSGNKVTVYQAAYTDASLSEPAHTFIYTILSLSSHKMELDLYDDSDKSQIFDSYFYYSK